jgi:KDO2-lipid IV(A) lauroyltransferase
VKVLYYLLLAVWWLFSLLPLRVHYVLSDLLYLILYRIAGYRVAVVRRNLSSSFPEETTDRLRDIERHFYHQLCDYFVETVKLMTMSRRQLRRRLVFHGIDTLDAIVREGQSCTIYLGHMFNWEYVTSLPLWLTSPVQCGQIYHALESPIFDRLFIRLRQRLGSVCIPMAETLRRLVNYKRKGIPVVIGFISDQVPFWNNIHHWCQFLHHDTPVLTGTERVSRSANHAILYLNMCRVRRGYYEAELQLITRQPQDMGEYEITDSYFSRLEQSIRRQPELWLWTHNRWKRTREEFDRRFQVVDGKVLPRKTEET